MVDQNGHVRLPEGIPFGRNMLEDPFAEWSRKGRRVQGRPLTPSFAQLTIRTISIFLSDPRFNVPSYPSVSSSSVASVSPGD